MADQDVVYVGPFTGIEVPSLGVVATKNVAITVDTAVGAVLLASSDWESSDAAANPAVTVSVAGQTLRITAVTVGGSGVTLYSDAASTQSVSLPATISADTTYYLAHNAEGALSMATSWPDGTVLTAVTGTTRNGKTLTVAPYPTNAQLTLSANLGVRAYATASLPAATAVPEGFGVFDTTRNQPLWSTGSVWVDATGSEPQ